jgi:hypothetical protein
MELSSDAILWSYFWSALEHYGAMVYGARLLYSARLLYGGRLLYGERQLYGERMLYGERLLYVFCTWRKAAIWCNAFFGYGANRCKAFLLPLRVLIMGV